MITSVGNFANKKLVQSYILTKKANWIFTNQNHVLRIELKVVIMINSGVSHTLNSTYYNLTSYLFSQDQKKGIFLPIPYQSDTCKDSGEKNFLEYLKSCTFKEH